MRLGKLILSAMVKPQFYEKHGLNVDDYDDQPGDGRGVVVKGDVAFYLGLAGEATGPVLELGCGNGRVLLPLARAGHDMTGLDLSRPMLDVLGDRLAREPRDVRDRVSLTAGDMCEFELGRRFGLIIIAFRSFQMLLTPEQEQRCLAAVRRHLLPEGRLVIDIFDPLLDLLVADHRAAIPSLPFRSGVHPQSGNEVRVEVLGGTNDRVAQTFEETWRFIEIARDGTTLRTEEEVLRMRWIYRWEMRYLLEREGFSVEAEYSDFEASPPAYGKEQVWITRLA
jgi:SAM-dependent methyltransferase